jgi:hypothetical protein
VVVSRHNTSASNVVVSRHDTSASNVVVSRHDTSASNVVVSRPQNPGHNNNLLMASKSSENVAQFEYFGRFTNQNCIDNEIKSTLDLGNACYHSAQSFVFLSRL